MSALVGAIVCSEDIKCGTESFFHRLPVDNIIGTVSSSSEILQSDFFALLWQPVDLLKIIENRGLVKDKLR